MAVAIDYTGAMDALMILVGLASLAAFSVGGTNAFVTLKTTTKTTG